LAAVNGQKSGRGKTADPGTDDNGVPGIGEREVTARRKFHIGKNGSKIRRDVARVNIECGLWQHRGQVLLFC
jgi:hypothetical protein